MSKEAEEQGKGTEEAASAGQADAKKEKKDGKKDDNSQSLAELEKIRLENEKLKAEKSGLDKKVSELQQTLDDTKSEEEKRLEKITEMEKTVLELKSEKLTRDEEMKNELEQLEGKIKEDKRPLYDSLTSSGTFSVKGKLSFLRSQSKEFFGEKATPFGSGGNPPKAKSTLTVSYSQGELKGKPEAIQNLKKQMAEEAKKLKSTG
jgi:hypothetical protein